MTITQTFITKNDCYKAGRKITVKGLMLHSVGCPQPKASVFINNWNKPGVEVAVHGIVDAEDNVFQLLPWDHRGWHGGGSCNNTHIGIEMTEPATIKYTGGASWVDLNPIVTKDHVLRTYATAVQLFAYLCKMYHLNPLGENVIISHSEGHALGIASNHGDVEHLWKAFGLTMDGFRRDVAAAMNINTQGTEKPVQDAQNTSGGVFKVGDVVSFAGGLHYPSATAVSGSWVAASKAKITSIYVAGKHPYHVRAIDANGNFTKGVYGWVDASTISKATEAEIKVGGKVKVLKAVTYDGKAFKTYYDQYDVIQISGDRVVIGIGKTVTAAVKKSHLQPV